MLEHEFPYYDNCENCDEKYKVLQDINGYLLTEGINNYLCPECRYNPNLKESDYRTDIKCAYDDCDSIINVIKKHVNLKHACADCLLGKFYILKENKGKTFNDVFKKR